MHTYTNDIIELSWGRLDRFVQTKIDFSLSMQPGIIYIPHHLKQGQQSIRLQAESSIDNSV